MYEKYRASQTQRKQQNAARRKKKADNLARYGLNIKKAKKSFEVKQVERKQGESDEAMKRRKKSEATKLFIKLMKQAKEQFDKNLKGEYRKRGQTRRAFQKAVNRQWDFAKDFYAEKKRNMKAKFGVKVLPLSRHLH